MDSTVNRAHQHGTNLPRHTGDLSSDKNLLTGSCDHAVGKSRGGLTTKIHAVVDGKQRPLILPLRPGHGGDEPVFRKLLDAIRMDKNGCGAPCTRMDCASADKAYPTRALCKYLRDRGIQCVIPEKEDQTANRKRNGKAAGR